MSVSTPQITPRAKARGVVSHAETPPAYVSRSVLADLVARAAQWNYPAWLEHIRPAAGCTRPIRLTGTVHTVAKTGDKATIVGQQHTDDMPDGHLYRACGNRRASLCPSCARIYQGDAYQLLRTGLVGGKGIPDTVARHPAVFATLTAPSFGPVHTRFVKRHTCTKRAKCDCRAEPCHARTGRNDPRVCPHGQAAVCFARHETGDPRIGQPLCLDCYDHDHHVVWNRYAGELWRRTKQAAERYLAALARRRGIPPVLIGYTPNGKPRTVAPVRLSHGKAAEYQRRGAVHFHALLRLDGVAELDPTAIVAPPDGFTTADITAAIEHAVRHTTFTTPAHVDRPAGWPIAWGEPDKGLDVKPITLAGDGEVTDGMVAGYLAKYATKSTEATGHRSTRITADTIGEYDPDAEHTARLIHACWRLGRPTHTPRPLAAKRRVCTDCGSLSALADCPRCNAHRQGNLDAQAAKSIPDNPWQGLRRWAHMLGFGGHFLTKARYYSVTMAYLRGTRVAYRRVLITTGPADPPPANLDETTLIVGTLDFAGVGWHTTADAILANTAAALARERHAVGREEYAHEIGQLVTASKDDNGPGERRQASRRSHAPTPTRR